MYTAKNVKIKFPKRRILQKHTRWLTKCETELKNFKIILEDILSSRQYALK